MFVKRVVFFNHYIHRMFSEYLAVRTSVCPTLLQKLGAIVNAGGLRKTHTHTHVAFALFTLPLRVSIADTIFTGCRGRKRKGYPLVANTPRCQKPEVKDAHVKLLRAVWSDNKQEKLCTKATREREFVREGDRERETGERMGGREREITLM